MSGECLTDVGQGWLIGGVVVLGYLALLATVGLAERARERFGQRRTASLFYQTPLLAGITMGSGVGVALALGPSWSEHARRALDGVPGTEAVLVSAVVTVVAAVWAVVVATQLPAALRHARQRQETIERLRRDGTRWRLGCAARRSGYRRTGAKWLSSPIFGEPSTSSSIPRSSTSSSRRNGTRRRSRSHPR